MKKSRLVWGLFTFVLLGIWQLGVADLTARVAPSSGSKVAVNNASSIEISGTVTDSSKGWPLHARISIDGYPDSPIYSDPVDGGYSVTLPSGETYQFEVEVLSGGYQSEERDIVANDGVDLTENFLMGADLTACTAPGYVEIRQDLYFEDFESGPGGYSENVVSGLGMWEWGSPVTWPEACAGGSNCWGTVLDGNYPDDSEAVVFSPIIDLRSASGPLVMTWDQANHIETFSFDQGRVEFRFIPGPSPVFVLWESPSGTVQVDWRELSADLSAAAGERIQLRWRLTTDSSVSFGGLYFDNIRIQELDCVAQDGELVIGLVSDANSGEGLNGAEIAVNGSAAASTANSEDPQLGDGAYVVFVPAGNSELSADLQGYEAAQFSDDFGEGTTRRVDFVLDAGQLDAVPGDVVRTITIGETDTAVVDLVNNGTIDAVFEPWASSESREDFESDFPPPGWTVENLGGNCIWARNDAHERPNYAGGDGFSAAADIDRCGSGTTMDTALVSPSFNVVPSTSVDFIVSFRRFGSSRLNVDITTDGENWTTLQSYTENLSALGPGEPQSLSLAGFAGESAHIRFRYVSPSAAWWAQVDQIKINAAVDWLDVTPATGSVNVGGTEALNLSFDAGAPSIMEPGEYTALIVVNNDTPYGLSVPVTMLVEPDSNLSRLNVQVSSRGYCDADPMPLSGATVEVTGQTESYTFTTDANGLHQGWLSVEQAPLSVMVSATGHLSVTKEVELIGAAEVDVAFDLTLDASCATVEPDSLQATMVLGGTNTLPLEIGNVDGGGNLVWTLGTAQALASFGLMAVDCESHPRIIIQDDGTIESGYSANPSSVTEVRFVDRFTPQSYPVQLSGVCVAFVTIGGSTTFNIDIVVYDDDGSDGMPGTELGSMPVTVTVDLVPDPLPLNLPPIWNAIDLSAMEIEVSAGSVYIGVRYAPQDPNYFVASDQSTDRPAGFADGHRWVSDVGTWVPLQSLFPSYRALMVRPVLRKSCDQLETISWLSFGPASGTTAAGASRQATLNLDAVGLAEGVYEAWLCVLSNDPVNPLIQVPVTMHVVDQAPGELAVDMTGHNFGQVGVGQYSVAEFTISNVAEAGAIGQVLSGFSIVGDADFSMVGGDCSVGSVLDPGESCTVAVMFAPSTLDSHSAVLLITSTDGQNAIATLAGEGVELPDGILHDRFEELDVSSVLTPDMIDGRRY